MTPTPRDVKSIFGRALELESPADRAAYLDEACGSDSGLRAEVEGLLATLDRAGAFMRRPAAAVAAGVTVNFDPVTEGPGMVIGRYKLMEQIGEGGMGLVFVADQQEPVRRRVALKVIKPGMDTRDVIARFEAERQALALMDHPNIARVLDAGATESGRPYFVMELVRGVAITDFCDQQQLTPRERLGLFVSVCQAVQHAHSKGVIHRDLKPSNVLVTLQEGVPTVKVIDFGVAKAVGQSLTDRTVYTRFAQMIGTPLYMSPEQAAGGPDVDTRCDIYALGVLLYELLTGVTPFDRTRLQKAAFDEVRRILREEEPPKPSTRLTTMGASLSAVSARRKTEPRRLSALVKGDLDWIVMKALEKDRNRRYESAGAFAADVRRHLAEEPVEARPPSALYRCSKLARRNRGALTAAALVAAALVAGTVVSVCLAVAAWRAEGDAQDATAKALKAKAESDDNARVANERKGQVLSLVKGLNAALYDADMTLVPAAWEADDLARFDQLMHWPTGLDEADERGFEWYFWNRLRHGEVRTVALAGGFHDFTSPAFSPGGGLFAAVVRVNGRGEVRLWDAATGAARRTLLTIPEYGEGLQITPARIAFSPDGGRAALSLLSFGKDVDPAQTIYRIPEMIHLQIHVWDTATGDELCHISLDRGGGRFDALAFGPKGKQLAFIAPPPPGRPAAGNVRVWDVDAGKEAFALPTPGAPRDLAFSPDGGRLAVALTREGWVERIPDDSNQVQIWDAASRKELLTIPPKGTVRNGPIAARDGASAPPLPPRWMGLLPDGVAFSPDGTSLAVVWRGAKDEVLALHDLSSGGVRELQGAPDAKGTSLRRPVFSADGRWVSCPAGWSVVHVWDAADGSVLYTVRGHTATPAVAFAGAHLVTAGPDGTVKEWARPAPPPQPPDLGASSNYSPLAVAFTPTGLRLARAFLLEDGGKKTLEVRAWDESGGASRVAMKAQLALNKIQHLVFNTDGTRLAADFVMAASTEAKPRIGLRVWDVVSGAELLASESGSLLMGLAISADGRRVAWIGEGRARAWDVGSGQQLLDVPEPWSMPLFPSFSADGSRLAWAGDRRIRVWDVDAAREVRTVADPGGQAGPLALSPDGTRLAAAVGPVWVVDEVKVWDVADGHEVMDAKSQRSVQDLVFNPDGSRLAVFRWQHDQKGDRSGVTLWDPAAGLPLLWLSVPTGYGGGQLRFRPDGRRLYLFNQYPPPQGAAFEVWDATPTAEGRSP